MIWDKVTINGGPSPFLVQYMASVSVSLIKEMLVATLEFVLIQHSFHGS